MNPNVLQRKAACSSFVMRATSTPLILYDPDVGTSRHPMMFISVDLPDPDWPMIATKSPFSTVKSTFFKTWVRLPS